MIKRLWHGWCTTANADIYQNLLLDEVLPGIEARKIAGYRGTEVLRREGRGEVEFITIMTFDSLQNVIDFQGEHYERCYVPDAAKSVLKRWDLISAHFESVAERVVGGNDAHSRGQS